MSSLQSDFRNFTLRSCCNFAPPKLLSSAILTDQSERSLDHRLSCVTRSIGEHPLTSIPHWSTAAHVAPPILTRVPYMAMAYDSFEFRRPPLSLARFPVRVRSRLRFSEKLFDGMQSFANIESLIQSASSNSASRFTATDLSAPVALLAERRTEQQQQTSIGKPRYSNGSETTSQQRKMTPPPIVVPSALPPKDQAAEVMVDCEKPSKISTSTTTGTCAMLHFGRLGAFLRS